MYSVSRIPTVVSLAHHAPPFFFSSFVFVLLAAVTLFMYTVPYFSSYAPRSVIPVTGRSHRAKYSGLQANVCHSFFS